MTQSLNNKGDFTELLKDDHAVLDNAASFKEREPICSTKKCVIYSFKSCF
jgi:hypothetical protein